jgi:exonuclease SbcC
VNRREGLGAKIAALDEDRFGIGEADRKVKAAEKELGSAQKSLEDTQNKIAEKTAAHATAKNNAVQAPALEAACREAERVSGRRQSLEECRGVLGEAQKAYNQAENKFRQAEDSYAAAKEELSGLQERWNKGQAAILAGRLITGEPCPVCGSADHPKPAAAGAEVPSEADLKARKLALNDLEATRDKAKDEYNSAEAVRSTVLGRIQDLEKELGAHASLDPAVLAAGATEAKGLWTQASTAAEAATALDSELKGLQEQEASAGKALEGCRENYQKAHTMLEAQRAVLQEREAAVPADLRDPAALQQARQEAGNRRELLRLNFESAKKAAAEASQALVRAATAEQEAMRTSQGAAQRLADEKRSFDQRLKEAGFDSLKEYEAARKVPEAVQRLEREINEFREKLFVAKDHLERAAGAAEGLAEPDLAVLAQNRTEAENIHEQSLRREEQLRTQVNNEIKWLKDLQGLEDAIKELADRYAVLGRLSQVANGANKYGLTFQRFVLGALLDDVTIAATERLKLMSRGRYHLQRTMDRARSNAAGGLDLEVFDTYTGAARSVATLSGGETFLASLSLALGLADVVQSYSGGIHLDTIFVDEGFGSLDPESLDFALRALLDLQKGGRLVGIISHVPELKERIDARLEVLPTDRGSAASFRIV